MVRLFRHFNELQSDVCPSYISDDHVDIVLLSLRKDISLIHIYFIDIIYSIL